MAAKKAFFFPHLHVSVEWRNMTYPHLSPFKILHDCVAKSKLQPFANALWVLAALVLKPGGPCQTQHSERESRKSSNYKQREGDSSDMSIQLEAQRSDSLCSTDIFTLELSRGISGGFSASGQTGRLSDRRWSMFCILQWGRYHEEEHRRVEEVDNEQQPAPPRVRERNSCVHLGDKTDWTKDKKEFLWY